MSSAHIETLVLNWGKRVPVFGSGINTTARYDSISGSVANRIEEANGRLLPVDAPAFKRETKLNDMASLTPSFSFLKLEVGCGSPREFYELLGITIQEPQGDMLGWYQCRLPDGWHAKRAAMSFSRDEATHFCDETGKTRFSVISEKNDVSQCLMITTSLGA